MNSKRHFKFRSILLFFIAGYFVLQTLALALREAIARFENPALTTGLVLFFLSTWSAAGALLFFRASNRDRENRPFVLTGALIFLPPAALISTLSAMFFPLPAIGVRHGLPALVACSLFSTMWLGLFIGVIMAMLFAMKKQERVGGELFYCCGLVTGGIAFPLLSERFNSAPAITALAGIVVIVGALVAGGEHFRQRGVRALLWTVASLALLLDACGVYASQKLFQIYWRQTRPEWNYLKSINTPTGRMTVLSRPHGELLVLDNGAPRWRVPQDSRQYIAGMLPATLQPDSNNLQILLIASPFSQIPQFLLELPQVAEVSLLCPYKELIMLALNRGLLPVAPGRFFVASFFPEEYLQNTETRFDVIIMLEPGFAKTVGSEDIYRLAAEKLTTNGIVLSVAPSASEKTLPLENYFKKKMPAPGCAALIMSSNGSSLTNNLNKLEERLARLSASREGMIPKGVFATLYSLPEDERPPASGLAMFNCRLQKSIMAPPPLPVILIIATCISAYIIMRFFMSRTGNHALGFGTFENGFFTLGLFILLLLAYQQGQGDLYAKTPVFLGMLGGVALGRIFLPAPGVKTALAAISCLCPLLLYFNESSFFYPLLLIGVLVMAVSAGMAEEILARRATLMKRESFPALRFLGHACGIVFFPFILFQSNGVLISVALLLLLRLPLLFSAMPYHEKN